MNRAITEEQKIAEITRLANLNICRAINDAMLDGIKTPLAAFIHVLENAELIRGFTKNDKMKCRQIGIVIGYFVRTNRYVNRLKKDKNEEFIQNGYAYVRAKNHD